MTVPSLCPSYETPLPEAAVYCPACGVVSPTVISQETGEDRTVRQPDVDETAYRVRLQQALRVARDLGFLADEDWRTLDILRDHAGKLTWGLYRAVSNAHNKKGSKTNPLLHTA